MDPICASRGCCSTRINSLFDEGACSNMMLSRFIPLIPQKRLKPGKRRQTAARSCFWCERRLAKVAWIVFLCLASSASTIYGQWEYRSLLKMDHSLRFSMQLQCDGAKRLLPNRRKSGMKSTLPSLQRKLCVIDKYFSLSLPTMTLRAFASLPCVRNRIPRNNELIIASLRSRNS